MIKKFLFAIGATLFSFQVSAQQVKYYVDDCIGLAPYEVKKNKGGKKDTEKVEGDDYYRESNDFVTFEVGLKINEFSNLQQVVNQLKVQAALAQVDTVDAYNRVRRIVNDYNQTIYYLVDTAYYHMNGDRMSKVEGRLAKIPESFLYSALVVDHYSQAQESAYLTLEVLPSVRLSANSKHQTIYAILNGFDILKSLHMNPEKYAAYRKESSSVVTF